MGTDKKIIFGIIALTIAIFIGAIFYLNKTGVGAGVANTAEMQQYLVRPDSNVMATDSAKVTLVEFGDYQCPSCGMAHPIVKRILDKYQGKLTFVFRNFPLPMHKNARAAAYAAEAAGEQGKYWQMHDLLYENQKQWSDTDKPDQFFDGYAEQLGLDMNAFRLAYQTEKYKAKVDQDVTDGNKLGVFGTPTFYVNGKKLSDFGEETFIKTIDPLL